MRSTPQAQFRIETPGAAELAALARLERAGEYQHLLYLWFGPGWSERLDLAERFLRYGWSTGSDHDLFSCCPIVYHVIYIVSSP
jgi:hypothetical protein